MWIVVLAAGSAIEIDFRLPCASRPRQGRSLVMRYNDEVYLDQSIVRRDDNLSRHVYLPTQSRPSRKGRPTASGVSIAMSWAFPRRSRRTELDAQRLLRRWRRCASGTRWSDSGSRNLHLDVLRQCSNWFRSSAASRSSPLRMRGMKNRRRASTQPDPSGDRVQSTHCVDECHCRRNDRRDGRKPSPNRDRRTCHDGIRRRRA